MLILKQSTAIDIRMGPFVDATDGVTPETGVTLGAADQAEVLKANGAATAAMSGTFAAVTGAAGWYDYTASTADTNTVGEVVFVVQDSSVCLPVFVRAQVVEEAVYDAMYGASATGPVQSSDLPTNFGDLSITATTGRVDVDSIGGTAQTANDNGADINAILADTNELQTDWANGGRLDAILDARATAAALATVDANVDAVLDDTGTSGVVLAGIPDVNMAQISGSSTAADRLEASALQIIEGAATAGTLGTTQMSTDLTEATDDHFIGRIIIWTSGALSGQASDITDYTGVNGVLTFTATTEAPSNGDGFIII